MNTTIKTHTVQGEPMHIHIRLSDPCHNGHNDFAITADVWRKGSVKLVDRNWDRGGCLHEDILKKMPSLKLFVNLHLSDEQGAPMYAVENGYYHMCNSDIKIFADYMRISMKEAEAVKAAYINKPGSFSGWVETLRPKWLAEANQAKEKLASLINNQ